MNLDAYTLLTIQMANVPPFQTTFGFLGAGGTAQAAIEIPAGFLPSLAGVELHHGALLFGASFAVKGTTNAVALKLNP